MIEINNWFDIQDADTFIDLDNWQNKKELDELLDNIFENIRNQMINLDNLNINYLKDVDLIKPLLDDELLVNYYDHIRSILDELSQYLTIPNYNDIRPLNNEIEKIFRIIYEVMFLELREELCIYLMSNIVDNAIESNSLSTLKRAVIKFFNDKISSILKLIALLDTEMKAIDILNSKIDKYNFIVEIIRNSDDALIEYIDMYRNKCI